MITNGYSMNDFISLLKIRCEGITRDDCEIFIGDTLSKVYPVIRLNSLHLISEFNNQGSSGGNCWEGKSIPYHSSSRPIEFGEVLLELTYKQVKKLPIQKFKYMDKGYYENYDEYEVEIIDIDEIYKMYITNQIQIELE